MTGRAAFVLGQPIEHSLSPAIHNAAFEAAGLAVLYSAWEVSPGDLPAVVGSLRRPEVLGANVTLPHKEAVLGLLDEVDDVARAIGAVNTIHHVAGRLRGSNTDVAGFARSLAEAGIAVQDRPVVLLGAGGSARAVSQALLAGGARRLVIANRHPERAQGLADDLRRRLSAASIAARPLAALTGEDVQPGALVVNTTTVGLIDDATPLPAALLPEGGAVVDIIYNPPRTRLLLEADRAGLPTLNGLSMLVHQAAVAWETWTGRLAPLEVMLQAAIAELEQRRRA